MHWKGGGGGQDCLLFKRDVWGGKRFDEEK